MTTGAVRPGIQAYLDHLKAERGLAHPTLVAYAGDLERYAAYLDSLGVTGPADIDPAVVSGFPVSLTKAGLAPASVGRMTVAVRGLHRFWAADGTTAGDPARDVTPPAPGRHLPKALDIAAVEALIEATGGRGPEVTAEQLGDWALVELLYGTGARISEALALTTDDASRLLESDTATLRLTGKGGKQRVVPVGSFARRALEAWLVRGRPQLAGLARRPTTALFLGTRGAPLTRQNAFNRIEALGRKAGLAVPVSPHTLRHSYATHLIDGGADVRVVQELLGHSSVATTQIYTLITVDHLREVYRGAHPRALARPGPRPTVE